MKCNLTSLSNNFNDINSFLDSNMLDNLKQEKEQTLINSDKDSILKPYYVTNSILEKIFAQFKVKINVYTNDYSYAIREAMQCNDNICTTKGYDTQGGLLYDLNCKNGKFDGMQQISNRNGQLIMEINANKGNLQGIQNLYNDSGSTLFSFNIVDKKLDGIARYALDYTDSNAEILFNKGNPRGQVKMQDDTQKIILNFNEKGKLDGTQQMFIKTKILRKGSLGINATDGAIRLWNDYYVGYKTISGAYVASVYIDSAGYFAGLMDNDLIVSVDGNAVSNAASLIKILSNKKEGDVVSIEFYRGEEKMEVEATLQANQQDSKDVNKEYLSVEERFNNGVKVEYKEWYENNKMKKHYKYNENGQLDGTQREWDEKENLTKAEIYKNGERVEIIR